MRYVSLSHLFRSAFRSRIFALVNIFGLAFGLAIAMFLLIYLQFEFSYDKHFTDANRIYRVLSVIGKDGEQTLPFCFRDFVYRLRQEVPEVEAVTQLSDQGVINFSADNSEYMGIKVYQVDSTFFRIFDFKPVYGQLEKALDLKDNCVITRTTSERYFGKGVDPVGKSLTVFGAGKISQIAAVIEDVPQNTHFNFDILIRLPEGKWNYLSYYTYVKFKPGIDKVVGVEKCNALCKLMLEERVAPWVEGKYNGITEPLTDIHISTQADFDLSNTASKTNLIFIVLIVIFVLGIAVSNFTSLYIIQGEQKALEISVRKTNGADRLAIVGLLFKETFLVTFCAFVLSLGLFYGFSSRFAEFLDFHWPQNAGLNWEMGVEFLILFLFLGLVVGGYPAYYLSKFNPRELIQKSDVRKYRLTAASVVIQFSIVIFCISALFVIWRQLDYVKNLSLGFHPENILEVRVDFPYSKVQGIRSELMQYPFIEQVAFGNGNPMEGNKPVTIRRTDQSMDEVARVYGQFVGPAYLKLYEIGFLEGHDFEFGVDTTRKVILSESAVKSLGFKDNPIGQQIYYMGEKPWTVIGVVNDILVSAHKKVEGCVYTSHVNYYYYLSVKFTPGNYAAARNLMLEVLDKYYKIPFSPLLTTDKIQQLYHQDRVTSRILTCGTVLAIILALLGLLALTAFVATQKRKEISIRRVLGARVDEIIYGLNCYIIVRILPAIPIGIGASYYAMNQWIRNFEYAKPLSWWLFALAVLVTLGITVFTIFYQSWKAASANPVDALKGE